MINNFKYYLSTIGYYGPQNLTSLIIATFFYKNMVNPIIYIFLIIWKMVNHLINISIKNTLQLPRPDSNKEEFSKLKPTFKNFLSIHKEFGMPSGHAQDVWWQLTFIVIYFKNNFIKTAAVLQAIITLWQRYNDKRHSLCQLFVGSLIGIAVGVMYYRILTTYIQCDPIQTDPISYNK